MCSRSDIEHLQPEPEPERCTECGLFAAETQGLCGQCLERVRQQFTQPAPARDPLWPNGNRPLCGQCHERYVYMAGLCGRCWAEWSRAEADTALERHQRSVKQPPMG